MKAFFACLLLLLSLPASLPGETPSSTEARREVPRNEQLKFEQDKARANMRELEDRMFRLAELIRSLQPEDSARLLMGVQRAREHLIADRMGEASKLLASLDLEQAAGEQKEIILHLENLKKLLLTTDLDLEIKLDQLRKITAALEQLDKLTAREQQQRDDSGDLEAPFNRDSLKGLEQGEKRNEQAGEQIRQLTEKAGPRAAAAGESLKQAGQSMGGAAGKLGQGQPREATPRQDDALKHLKEAGKELTQLQQQLREEVEGMVRRLVMNQLKDMLAQQVRVRETTEKLEPRVAQGNRQAFAATRRLAPAEDRISELAVKARGLVELTRFSLVLPVALGTLNTQMIGVGADLGKGLATPDVIANEKHIEASIESLLEAMEDASRFTDATGQGQCKGCKGNRNKLLAEVKMLRWMQVQVNGGTREVHQLRQANQLGDRALERRAGELQVQQNDVRRIAEKLHSETCRECLQGLH